MDSPVSYPSYACSRRAKLGTLFERQRQIRPTFEFCIAQSPITSIFLKVTVPNSELKTSSLPGPTTALTDTRLARSCKLTNSCQGNSAAQSVHRHASSAEYQAPKPITSTWRTRGGCCDGRRDAGTMRPFSKLTRLTTTARHGAVTTRHLRAFRLVCSHPAAHGALEGKEKTSRKSQEKENQETKRKGAFGRDRVPITLETTGNVKRGGGGYRRES